ncbi:MAG TPA: carbohydrate kinase family protein [Fimbriimonas sp.]
MSQPPPEVVVAGHICLDIIPGLSRIAFEPGRLFEAGNAVLSTGGAVSNTGLALHRLGVRVALVGKVGDDLFGGNVRSLLDRREAGLGESLTVAPGEPTSYTIVINLSGVDRMFLHAPGCNNTFTADDVPMELLESCRLMHFGYPPLMARMFEDEGRELESLLRKAKSAGATTSLDLSLPDKDAPSDWAPWRAILERCLPWVDVFLPSYDELLYMLDLDAYEARKREGLEYEEPPHSLVEDALSLGAKVVGLKLGDQGMLLRTAKDLGPFGRAAVDSRWLGVSLSTPSFEVDVAGTTGSGDAAIAGFLMGMMRGFSPEEAVQAAVAVGACCCEAPDATSGVRTWEETEQRIQGGWKHRA